VNVVIRLHEKAKIKVKVGEVESELESSIGVRQGSCEGPVLFLFIMQAAMETMKWPVPKPEFRTRANGVTMGGGGGIIAQKGSDGIRLLALPLCRRLRHIFQLSR